MSAPTLQSCAPRLLITSYWVHLRIVGLDGHGNRSSGCRVSSGNTRTKSDNRRPITTVSDTSAGTCRTSLVRSGDGLCVEWCEIRMRRSRPRIGATWPRQR